MVTAFRHAELQRFAFLSFSAFPSSRTALAYIAEMFLHFVQSNRSTRLNFSNNSLVDIVWTSAYSL